VGEPRTIRATMMTSGLPPPFEERLRDAGARYNTRQDTTGHDRPGAVRYGCGTSTSRTSEVRVIVELRDGLSTAGPSPKPSNANAAKGGDQPGRASRWAAGCTRARRRGGGGGRRGRRGMESERERERRDGTGAGSSSGDSFTKQAISPVAGSCGGGMDKKKKKEESQGRRARQTSQVPRTQNPAAAQQPILPDGESRSRPKSSRVKPRRTNERR
jgi:hypothetical protein